jgi:hypothetical protein
MVLGTTISVVLVLCGGEPLTPAPSVRKKDDARPSELTMSDMVVSVLPRPISSARMPPHGSCGAS